MSKEVKKKIESKNELINKHFVQFLRKRRLYRKFAREVRKNSGLTLSAYFKYFLDGEFPPAMYLSGAFHWAMSKDGREFWSKVNEEWEYLENETSYE